MFKIGDVIRIASETHMITRTHHPVTELHPHPRPLVYAAAGCGRSVDAADVIPWAPVAADSEPTCKGCAGTGPAVESLARDAALEIPHTVPARGWIAGRKGKGARMHGIPDVTVWTTVPVTSGRGKNKSTRHVVQWEAACGESVGGWDSEATVPEASGNGSGGSGMVPDASGDDGTVTRYAPHMTDAGAGGIQWCGKCAETFKALRGTVAPKGVLTSKAPANVDRYGEKSDAQDRANARAAWLGRVLPLVTLTLGTHGATVGPGSLVVVGKGGPVHAGALDAHGRMMLVCRTGVLSRTEWKRPEEDREDVTCGGCKGTIFNESDPLRPEIRPLVMGAILRGTSLPDAERFAPIDSGSGLTDHTSVTAPAIAERMTLPRAVKLPSGAVVQIRRTDSTLRRIADTDSSQKRFPFDRARGEFRTGARGKGERSPYTPEERTERRTAEREDLTHGRARLWNTVEFTATHHAAPGGKRHVTMVISRDIAERLGGMVTGPDGDRITGWDYVYAMGALPASVKAVLTREERARLYGGGKAAARRATVARKARTERARDARGVAASREATFGRYRLDDGTRADQFGRVVYGSGRDFSDRAGSRVI